MERPPIPEREKGGGSKEQAEAKTSRREFEYLDSEGRLLGRSEIELEGPELETIFKTVRGSERGKGRRLKSFIIKGEKDGIVTEVDMLALANPHGVAVVCATEHLVNYAYSGRTRVALVPPLETPLDVGVFLHELGHADQYHEKRFDAITKLHGKSKPLATTDQPMISFSSLMDLLEAVGNAVPDAKKVLDHESIQQLQRLEATRQDALGRKSDAERELEERELSKSDDMQVAMLQEKVDRIFDEAKAAEHAQETLIASVNLRDIAALPTRMMERDATRRALQRLRTVRQRTGVDLLAPHLVPPEALVAAKEVSDDGCVASTAVGLTSTAELNVEASVLTDLKNALATYGADKMRLKPPDDDSGPGFIPIAGVDRSEKK